MAVPCKELGTDDNASRAGAAIVETTDITITPIRAALPRFANNERVTLSVDNTFATAAVRVTLPPVEASLTPATLALPKGKPVFRPRPFGTMSVLMPVNLNCQYRSTDARVGRFGPGMSFTYDWCAEALGAEAVRVTNPAGAQFMLSREADGVFRARNDRSLAIEMEVTPMVTGRTLKLADGMCYEFGTEGRLTAVVDLAGIV